MKTIDLNKLTIYGELAMRINLNFARLETKSYWPETIFEMDQNSWPADWEGRTMLALVMHAQTTNRMPAFLDEILEQIPDRLNEKGYIGPAYDDGIAHEQAMSGHNWMIRALVEYYNWKTNIKFEHADKALSILKSIINSLYIPQTENYKNYPIDEATRYDDPNWILSHNEDLNWAALQKKTNSGTSDCGCAFIAIDGATAAYELLKQDDLKSLIEAMINSYETLPREKLQMQTHATLSGLRGILRYYRITGEQRYLKIAINVFDLYKTNAWTENYANYNWFGLPRWTEPCAIIDSFMIAQELWGITGKEIYLQDAHHILYNAIAHAQRANGAFGTDLCVGVKIAPAKAIGISGWGKSEKAIIHAKSLTYEVFWCCNMRGGDGLSQAAMYSFYTDENTVIIPYYHTCDAELELSNGILKLHEKADYPFSGKVTFNIKENTADKVQLRFFAPEAWTSGAVSKVLINGKEVSTTFENGFVCVKAKLNAGDTIIFDTEMKFYISDGNCCINNSKDNFSFRHGPMMLGVHSVLENAEADPEEINIPRDAEMKYIKAGRYETKNDSGQTVILQPMWGKENMIEPLDVYQVLF